MLSYSSNFRHNVSASPVGIPNGLKPCILGGDPIFLLLHGRGIFNSLQKTKIEKKHCGYNRSVLNEAKGRFMKIK